MPIMCGFITRQLEQNDQEVSHSSLAE